MATAVVTALLANVSVLNVILVIGNSRRAVQAAQAQSYRAAEGEFAKLKKENDQSVAGAEQKKKKNAQTP
ncbi:unnamed protein product [Cuscuta campestris]|uniref:Uncharacterized protein n=1 Tax=Cuscuta campestris TaxID=132261 RepID=A0A484KRP1_9ASTE|nr:unnamed protein product [Cuscuta campestris]